MDREARDADNRRKKRWRVMRQRGTPALVLKHEYDEARAKVRAFRARGMAYHQMHDVSGVSMATLCNIYEGTRPTMTRRNYDLVMAMEFALPDKRGARRDVAGAARRIRALRYAGYSGVFLAEQMDTSDCHIRIMGRGAQTSIHASLDDRIRQVFEKLRFADPVDHGISHHGVLLSRTWARKQGYAPEWCWDDDTIDDPNTIPEWTGACGTAQGAAIHQREEIPLCEACRVAVGADPYTDHTVRHSLSEIDPYSKEAFCDTCDRRVDVYGWSKTLRSGEKKVHYRCGPRMRAAADTKRPKSKRVTDRERIEELTLAGKTASEIAEELGISQRTVTRTRKALRDKEEKRGTTDAASNNGD